MCPEFNVVVQHRRLVRPDDNLGHHFAWGTKPEALPGAIVQGIF